MDLKKYIKDVEAIKIGFDIKLAEQKTDKIILLVDYVENKLNNGDDSISREDIISVLQQVYSLVYEIGITKQDLESHRDVQLVKKILPIARFVYNKTKDLLPYLYLNMDYLIGDEKAHRSLEQEISEIENGIIQ